MNTLEGKMRQGTTSKQAGCSTLYEEAALLVINRYKDWRLQANQLRPPRWLQI
jgi:hypothetical protein